MPRLINALNANIGFPPRQTTQQNGVYVEDGYHLKVEGGAKISGKLKLQNGEWMIDPDTIKTDQDVINIMRFLLSSEQVLKMTFSQDEIVAYNMEEYVCLDPEDKTPIEVARRKMELEKEKANKELNLDED